jgi:hypothetical protein
MKSLVFKIFAHNQRKKIKKGIFAAPVWVFSKIGKRLYNKYGKTNWRVVDMGKRFKKFLRKKYGIKIKKISKLKV